MTYALTQEERMLKDLVARFVKDELIPLENKVLARDAAGEGMSFTREEQDRLDSRSKELGLWGLDAPEEFGGSNLPVTAMVGVDEELGKCALQYRLPPDSPNLRML
ncbi:MAG TPA: acyl-CoA dehydrogenase family protein, partial [Burkholderiales bacterium]|nr:acyl-CoA dehydrogenase family protein [Burkholderiales bacterium]